MYYLNSDNYNIEKNRPQQEIKSRNLKLLFDMIGSGCVTRTTLTQASGLSASAVTMLIDELISNNYVSEAGPGMKHNGGGRRQIPLKINPAGAQIPVFSISEYGIIFTLYDLQYNILERIFSIYPKFPESDSQDNAIDVGSLYADIIENVLLEKTLLFDKDKAPAILISYPGAYHSDLNIFLMTGFNTTFPEETLVKLEERIGIPLFIGNASNALAYAEKKYLLTHNADAEEMIYVNVCGGVGSGIVYKDRLMPLKGELSGEIGHMTIEVGGRSCPCGNKGCLERYVSINAIIHDVYSACLKAGDTEKANELINLPSDMALAAIGRYYNADVPPVAEIIDAAASKLFAGIYSIVNVTGIRRVVIGGLKVLGDKFLNKVNTVIDGNRSALLMKSISISYGDVSPDADSIGIAQYYIDKIFTIK